VFRTERIALRTRFRIVYNPAESGVATVSAWIVSENHIRLLAQAQALYGDGSIDDLDVFCSDLFRENVASVNYRYPNHPQTEARPIEYAPVFGGEDPVAFRVLAVKSLQCYGYQSCEHPEWEASEAKRKTERLEAAILATFPQPVDPNSLPGYDAAPWGFE
jgi:hypothetical protein